MTEENYLLNRVDECTEKTRLAMDKRDMPMAAFWSRAAIGFLNRYAQLDGDSLVKLHAEEVA